MSMYDPTRYEDTLPMPIIDPTTPAHPYINPYERTSTYGISDIPIPPPPPRKKRDWLKYSAITGLVFIVLGGVAGAGLMIYYAGKASNDTVSHMVKVMVKSSPTVVIETPTPAPRPTIIVETPTPAPQPHPQPPYTAGDIYQDFRSAGIYMSNPSPDNNWCPTCNWTPSGGAIVWQDTQSGTTMEIATFYANAHVVQDAAT